MLHHAIDCHMLGQHFALGPVRCMLYILLHSIDSVEPLAQWTRLHSKFSGGAKGRSAISCTDNTLMMLGLVNLGKKSTIGEYLIPHD